MRRIATALVLVLACGVARADKDSLASVLEGELGFGVVYNTSDYVGLNLYTGFSLGKPLLGACYLEPLVDFEIDFTLTNRVTAKLRCNFVTSPGHQISLGIGAGFGNHASQDSDGNMTSTPMSFREVEIAAKLGGKRRFLIGLAIAFDGTAGEPNTLLLQTTLVRAYP